MTNTIKESNITDSAITTAKLADSAVTNAKITGNVNFKNIIINGDMSVAQRGTSFSGITTTINNRTYYLGQNFVNGLSTPEVKKYSGSIIHVDHRPAITRSSVQKEDIKIILQF